MNFIARLPTTTPLSQKPSECGNLLPNHAIIFVCMIFMYLLAFWYSLSQLYDAFWEFQRIHTKIAHNQNSRKKFVLPIKFYHWISIIHEQQAEWCVPLLNYINFLCIIRCVECNVCLCRWYGMRIFIVYDLLFCIMCKIAVVSYDCCSDEMEKIDLSFTRCNFVSIIHFISICSSIVSVCTVGFSPFLLLAMTSFVCITFQTDVWFSMWNMSW